MNDKKGHIIPLWAHDGCITPEALQRFIDNELTTEEKRSIENHAAQCELCADALEGARLMYSGESMMKNVASIYQELITRTSKSKKRRLVPLISAAASVLIIIGIFFLYQKHDKHTFVAEHKLERNEQKPAETGNVAEAVNKEIVEKAIVADKDKETPKQSASVVKQDISSGRIQENIISDAELETFEPLAIISMDEDIEQSVDYKNEVIDELAGQVIDRSLVGGADLKDKVVNDRKIQLGEEVALVTEYDEMEGYYANETAKKTDLLSKKGNRSKSTVKESYKQADNYVEIQDVPAASIEPVAPNEYNGEVLVVVEKMPIFQNGDIKKFKEWIYTQLHYDSIPTVETATGKVIVKFHVDDNGDVKDVTVIKSHAESFNKEVVRIIKTSPKWEPGMQSGKPVSVEMVISIYEANNN